jgi:hypothetical protein
MPTLTPLQLISLVIYKVSQEESSIFWEVIVSVILTKKVYTYMCPIPNSFRDTAISLYSAKIVDKKEIVCTVSNASINHSSDKVGTVYLVKYIFENSTININALCNSCENRHIAHLYSLSRKPFGMGHMHVYNFFLRMTDTMTSQNTDLSSWDTCIESIANYEAPPSTTLSRPI